MDVKVVFDLEELSSSFYGTEFGVLIGSCDVGAISPVFGTAHIK